MASLTEHVLINKLGDDLNSAIMDVGGDPSSVTHICQYPNIIRDQLASIKIINNMKLEGGQGIQIDSNIQNGTLTISADSQATIINDISYKYDDETTVIIQKGESIQDAFGKIIDFIGDHKISEFVLEGDSCIIKSDENGYDQYSTRYAAGTKTGLNPNTFYIRICTAVKDIEPVYIDLTPICNGQTGGEVQEEIQQIQQDVQSLTKDLTEINDTLNEILNTTESDIVENTDIFFNGEFDENNQNQ